MKNRIKRVRRGDGSVYRTNGKRERWKAHRTGINRRVQSSMDRTKQNVWRKGENNKEKKGKVGKIEIK